MKHGGGLQLEVYIRSVIAALRHPWHANLRSFPKVYSFLVFFWSAIALATAHGESIDMMELGESFPLQPTPIPVKMQFITQKVQQYSGDTLIKYHAALCGGCQFDGHTGKICNQPCKQSLGPRLRWYHNCYGQRFCWTHPGYKFGWKFSACAWLQFFLSREVGVFDFVFVFVLIRINGLHGSLLFVRPFYSTLLVHSFSFFAFTLFTRFLSIIIE